MSNWKINHCEKNVYQKFTLNNFLSLKCQCYLFILYSKQPFFSKLYRFVYLCGSVREPMWSMYYNHATWLINWSESRCTLYAKQCKYPRAAITLCIHWWPSGRETCSVKATWVFNAPDVEIGIFEGNLAKTIAADGMTSGVASPAVTLLAV